MEIAVLVNAICSSFRVIEISLEYQGDIGYFELDMLYFYVPS
jgi:hypothetical protein